MTIAISPDDWLRFLQREYLDGFVRDGGASIKFAVPLDQHARETVSDGLIKSAALLHYLPVVVDAGRTRVHLIDQLFFEIAAQVPWQDTVNALILRIAREQGYDPPIDGSAPILERIAAANTIDLTLLRMDFRRKIERAVFKNWHLVKDFRVAMTSLTYTALGGGAEYETAVGAITDWLTGRNKAISAVKPYHIFSRVNRSNARFLLESLPPWLELGGFAGLVLILDISRLSVVRNPRDEYVYYSKAAVMDAYEVLRQFIDRTDRLVRTLIVTVPDATFLDDDVLGRGIGAYEALKFRVFDEVRDRALVNPMASLVRLEEGTI